MSLETLLALGTDAGDAPVVGSGPTVLGSGAAGGTAAATAADVAVCGSAGVAFVSALSPPGVTTFFHFPKDALAANVPTPPKGGASPSGYARSLLGIDFLAS